MSSKIDNNTQKNFCVHPHQFLKIDNGRLILWNYENHTQYELSQFELKRLVEISGGSQLNQSKIDQDFVKAGLVCEVDENNESQWGWDWLSQIFHIGTNHPVEPTWGINDDDHGLEYARDYLEYCQKISTSIPDIEIIKGYDRTSLPEPHIDELERASLWETLVARRTCRDFDQSPISLEQLATLLFVTFGSIAREENESEGLRAFGYRRTSPSAGGLQAVEPYIWITRVNDINPGLYHYLSCQHELELIRPGLPEDKLSIYLCNQHWANDLPFIVFMTGRFDKMWWKYPHSRAYRPLLMEVGHLSQTFLICSTALGLHGWMTGYFHDNELNELLDLNWPDEHVLFSIGAGYGSGSGYTREMKSIGQYWLNI